MTDIEELESLMQPEEPAPVKKKPTSKRRRRPIWLVATLFVVVAVAIALGTLNVVAPEKAEEFYGYIKVETQQVVADVTQKVPEVTLGRSGDEKLMDACLGGRAPLEWVHLPMYEQPGVLPVYAAHNVCGADMILSWPIGQEVMVDKADGNPAQKYVVSGDRLTDKWGPVSQIENMPGDGEFLLQTCLYGKSNMRFVELRPADETTDRLEEHENQE